jgi:ubiquitin carboxyl-terminal hydrolase 9/24
VLQENVLQENVKETGDSQVDEAVLEGHLGIAKELLSFMSPEKKYELGSEERKGINLIKVHCNSQFYIYFNIFIFIVKSRNLFSLC